MPPHAAEADEVVITVDVEWAHPVVLADIVGLLDERGLRATFFCTHDGIAVPGHERALHPNFRRSSNSLVTPPTAPDLLASERRFYQHVLEGTRRWCPEAVGTRSHSLIYDSTLLPLYREAGLEYDSTCMLPLAHHLSPVWKGHGILELPIFYMDFWDMCEGVTGFDAGRLPLEGPGLRVLCFHPNLVFLNAATYEDYLASKPHYQDVDWLLRHRTRGRGARTLFLDVLDALARRDPAPVLGDINARWRAASGR